MGDIADMMLDGTLCQQCGVYIEGEALGYPRTCNDCQRANAKGTPDEKVKCSFCKKPVRLIGLRDHLRDAHGVKPEDLPPDLPQNMPSIKAKDPDYAQCPHCGKWVRKQGLGDHVRMAHPEAKG